MKRRNVIISAVLTIVMCVSMIAGATYAIFTSEDTVNIAVSSGTVKMTAKLDSTSLVATSRGADVYMSEATDGKAYFATGGYAEVMGEGDIKLVNIVPGDAVTVNINVENLSNVDVQYRVAMGYTDGSDEALKSALVASANIEGVDYAMNGGVTFWKYLARETQLEDNVIEVTIELPYSVGNEVQSEPGTERSVGIVLTLQAVQGNADVTDEVSAQGGSSAQTAMDINGALGALDNADFTYKWSGYSKLTTKGQSGVGDIAPSHANNITLLGYGADSTYLVFDGAGVSAVANANGSLTFKDMTIVDNSVSYNESAWEFTYLELGGDLYFENVTFTSGIMLEADSNATFRNCTFLTEEDSVYAAWVSDGAVSFENCVFKGTRGLKIEEKYGTDVTEVTVDGCTFELISKKPGIAIGSGNDGAGFDASVVIKNSTFYGCQAGDALDDATKGVPYMYETDTLVSDFDFVEENNEIIMVDAWDGSSDSTWYDSAASEFVIGTAEELAGFSALVAAGNTFHGKTVKLSQNIDLAGSKWEPIGPSTHKCFYGTFDGNGYTIYNLEVEKDAGYGNGFFANLVGPAVVKNVTFEGASVSRYDASYKIQNGNMYGIVAGYAYGTVTLENVHVVDSVVIGFGKVGALIGGAADPGGVTTFKGCSVKNTEIYGTYNAGGLCGLSQNETVVEGCIVEAEWICSNPTDYEVFDNAVATEGDKSVVVSGTYWIYGDYRYAGYAKYYCDASVINNDYKLSDTVHLADGLCHN
ncbi:MAG: right-handed parallel beta-helix repeat-containing protein [Clostridia bacterium]|nr:right-handed parallel beta-helix repeat-containing protein [Clostridia bacterium]